LILGRNIKTIGDHSFSSCSSFVGCLSISSSVNYIGDFAFQKTSFDYCFFEGLSEINHGQSVFSVCKFFYTIVPDGYSNSTFSGFPISFNVNNEMSYTFNGNESGISRYIGNGNNELIIPNSINYKGQSYQVTCINNYAFANYKGLYGNVQIPQGIRIIGDYSFFSCIGLNGSISIPETVEEIGQYAFAECSNLKGGLSIPQKVTIIETCSFYSCTGLNGKLELPSSLEIIENHAFYCCSNLQGSLIIPKNTISIGNLSFFKCSGFNQLKLYDHLKTIGTYAFYQCYGFISSLELPKSLTFIDSYAFESCYGFSSCYYEGKENINYGTLIFANCSFSGVHVPLGYKGSDFAGYGVLSNMILLIILIIFINKR